MFNVFNGKSEMTETDTTRRTAIGIGQGFGIAEVQEFGRNFWDIL